MMGLDRWNRSVRDTEKETEGERERQKKERDKDRKRKKGREGGRDRERERKEWKEGREGKGREGKRKGKEREGKGREGERRKTVPCREGTGTPRFLRTTASEDNMDFVNALWKLVLGPRGINLNIEMIYPNSAPSNAP